MRSEPAPIRRTIALLCAMIALVACDESTTVLVRHGNNVMADGAAHTDASIDARVPDAAKDSGHVDATPVEDASDVEDVPTEPARVLVYATGFGAFVGMTVRGRLGPLSANVSAATVGEDGTFILEFPPVTFSVFDNIYFNLYVDTDGDGDCKHPPDAVGGKNVKLVSTGPDQYRVDLPYADLNTPFIACYGF